MGQAHKLLSIHWWGLRSFPKVVVTFSHVCGFFNTLRPRQNEQHFAEDIFKCIFFNENVWISIKISLKFVPKGPMNNIPALVQIMAWCRPGHKPLSDPMMVRLLTHICVTRPQRVNLFNYYHWECLNNLIFSKLQSCAACWARFSCVITNCGQH